MKVRHDDGSAGDANYGSIGNGYTQYRQPEPVIAARINEALGSAATVLNVGAGAGSYEPTDRHVTAIEPSAAMRAQRAATLPVAIDATAEQIPFPDQHFEGSLATFTVHQWSDLKAGLDEMVRVTSGPIVILTCDPKKLDRFWLNDYAHEVISTEARRYPDPAMIALTLGGTTEIIDVPIPQGCTDGFGEAYFGRPEMLLDPGARKANSAWSFVSADVEPRFVSDLTADLASGSWDAKHADLRHASEFDGSLVLIISRNRQFHD